LIRGAGLERIVDVRTIPKSRRHPQFVREEMQRWVPELSGAGYAWEPALGGFRRARPDSLNVTLRHPAFRGYADYMETKPFSEALERTLALARDSRLAAMCSETVWWRCHRRLIADAATLLHGVDVRHLMHDGTLRPHIVTEGARVTSEGLIRYGML
jgi:uncharacterized protein (DUF488 family)